MVTRQQYDKFFDTTHKILSIIAGKISTLKFKNSFKRNKDLEDVLAEPDFEFSEHIFPFFVLLVVSMVLSLVVFGVFGLVSTGHDVFKIALFVAPFCMSVSYLLVKSTFSNALSRVSWRHLPWTLFAYRVDLKKVFGTKSTFMHNANSFEVSDNIDKFLSRKEPHLGLWYIEGISSSGFFMRKSDIFYLKLKYYNVDLSKEYKEIIMEDIIDQLS